MQYVCCCALRLNLYVACSYLVLEPGTLYLKRQSHFIQETPKFPDLHLDDCRLKDLIILWNTSFYIPIEYLHKNRCQDDSGWWYLLSSQRNNHYDRGVTFWRTSLHLHILKYTNGNIPHIMDKASHSSIWISQSPPGLPRVWKIGMTRKRPLSHPIHETARRKAEVVSLSTKFCLTHSVTLTDSFVPWILTG